MKTQRLLSSLFAAAAGSVLIGCQTSNDTRVTVMNESTGVLLVDVMRAGSEAMVSEDARLEASGIQEFIVPNMDDAAVQIGVRAIEFESAPAQWVEFPAGGPYLLRVQGSATALRFLPSKDGVEGLKASDIDPIYTNRRANEPPVLPSR